MIIRGWSDKEKDILINNYCKIKIEELEILLPHKNRCAIQKYSKKFNLQGNMSLASRKYSYDETFFDTPNIMNCYWAGFIAADGNIGKDGLVTIGISSKDREILESFVLHTHHQCPIKTFYLEDKEYNSISCWGAYRWQDKLLEHWNILPNKSNILLPPNITNLKYIYAYIIGYFDGDGSVFWTKGFKYKVFHISLCGTQELLEWIKFYIHKLIKQETNASIKRNGHSEYNKRINWKCRLARTIHIKLSSVVDIDYKLKRKWDINYFQPNNKEDEYE